MKCNIELLRLKIYSTRLAMNILVYFRIFFPCPGTTLNICTFSFHTHIYSQLQAFTPVFQIPSVLGHNVI